MLQILILTIFMAKIACFIVTVKPKKSKYKYNNSKNKLVDNNTNEAQ